MALIQRKITIQIALVDGNGGSNTYTLEDHRVSLTVTNAGSASMGQANIRIFGMTLSAMNEISTLGLIPGVFKPNMVRVIAGDDVNGMSTIYTGTITAAWADMMGAPDIAFTIQATAGLSEAMLPIEPSSYPGTADVAVILSDLASKMKTPAYEAGLQFENNGVSVILATPYFPLSGRAQIEAVCDHANIDWTIENGKLAIWPKGASRSQPIVPEISADTGMVGYPAYTATGIVVTTQFNPTIRYGASVKVVSELKPACRDDWHVMKLTHDLECDLPGGKWFTQVQLARPGYDPI